MKRCPFFRSESMKLMMLAALAVATPIAAFAQTTPAPADSAATAPAAGADATQTAPAPADPAAAAPAQADPAAAAPAGGAPQMGAPTSTPAPAAQESYPVCSATVHDQCREGAGGKHMGGKHKAAHRKHK
jgi:hypothetical protein